MNRLQVYHQFSSIIEIKADISFVIIPCLILTPDITVIPNAYHCPTMLLLIELKYQIFIRRDIQSIYKRPSACAGILCTECTCCLIKRTLQMEIGLESLCRQWEQSTCHLDLSTESLACAISVCRCDICCSFFQTPNDSMLDGKNAFVGYGIFCIPRDVPSHTISKLCLNFCKMLLP